MAGPSGSTPVLRLPYPTPDDSVDVPRDIKALADSIEGGTGGAPGLIYVGEIRFIGVASAPAGWLACDGAARPRSSYSRLFAAIGTLFGAGDGSTTFNVPDLRGRVPAGAGAGTGLTARAVGTQWGVEAVLLTANQSGLRDHTHLMRALPVYTPAPTDNAVNANMGAAGGPVYVTSSGAAAAVDAHDNTQPSLAIPAYIYAGA